MMNGMGEKKSQSRENREGGPGAAPPTELFLRIYINQILTTAPDDDEPVLPQELDKA